MKKHSYIVAALLLLGSSSTLTSCFVGSFSCMNKMFEFNENMTNNRFISALVAFFIGPIEFSVGGFLDTVIFNTLEFWTGSNPLAATQVVQGQDGQYYAVASNGQGGYTVTCQQTGEQMEYLFEQESRTWSLSMDGKVTKLFSLTSPDEAVVYVPGMDEGLNIRLDEEGIMACEAAFNGNYDLALN